MKLVVEDAKDDPSHLVPSLAALDEADDRADVRSSASRSMAQRRLRRRAAARAQARRRLRARGSRRGSAGSRQARAGRSRARRRSWPVGSSDSDRRRVPAVARRSVEAAPTGTGDGSRYAHPSDQERSARTRRHGVAGARASGRAECTRRRSHDEILAPPPTYKANSVTVDEHARREGPARRAVPHAGRQARHARRVLARRAADDPDVQLLRLPDAVQPAAQRAVRRCCPKIAEQGMTGAQVVPRSARSSGSSRSISSRTSRSTS